MEIDPSGLLPHQPKAATELLRILLRNGAALDGSDMGVGKTFASAAVARALDEPTLVVCPQISITSWNRAAKHLNTEFDVLNYEMLRTGNTPYGTWENPRPKLIPSYFECTECQLEVKLEDPFKCPHHNLGIHCLKTRKRPHDYGKFRWFDGLKLLIFDEVQRCGATDSLHHEMLVAAKRQGIKVIGLSATVANSPLNFKALGYVLGLHHLVDRRDANLKGFYRWAMSYGCRKSPFGGLAFCGSEERRKELMLHLHSEIFPSRGIRVRTSDLGDLFPKCQITAELYDLEEAGRINELYAEMDDALQELNERKKLDKNLEHPLTRVLRAKQEIELLKVPIFEELALNGLENGRTVGLFVNFSQTVHELCKRLKTECRIDGSQVGPKGQLIRQGYIDRVQNDQERLIVLNNQAGSASISLQDMTGRFPRLGLVSLPNSANMFRQLCGRFPRAGGKSASLYRVVLAAGTVEVKQHEALAQKLNQMDVLNDGDLWACNLPLKKHSLDDLTAAECGV